MFSHIFILLCHFPRNRRLLNLRRFMPGGGLSLSVGYAWREHVAETSAPADIFSSIRSACLLSLPFLTAEEPLQLQTQNLHTFLRKTLQTADRTSKNCSLSATFSLEIQFLLFPARFSECSPTVLFEGFTNFETNPDNNQH
jgi:hypothetical protein